jgi:SSS family solute:Na+ symporter
LPPFDLKGGGLLAVWSLVVFLGLQWWAGGEGGGFLAQRLFSCKDEKHSMMAMLWFNFANFVLRPWPWIVVGVASLFLITDVTAYGSHYDPEHAYVIMLMKYMPLGLKGLLVASLMAAYMSTISTHVNFGASYVVNDLYCRFINKSATERGKVIVSQLASVFLAILAAIAAFYATNIGGLWLTMFELMSGAGFVILLRWYWWRINAWSELSAMFSTLGMWALLNHTQVFHGLFEMIHWPLYLLDDYAVRFSLNLVVTTIIWVTVTFLTPPEKEAHLVKFFLRIKPAGWWGDVPAQAGNPQHLTVGKLEWACWGLGVTGLFSMIFALGKLCFGLYLQGALFAVYGVIATIALLKLIGKMDWSAMEETKE